jgi:hypothetical protein
MKLNVEIELSIDEINFLKKYFDDNRVPNKIFLWDVKPNLKENQKNYFEELQSKGVIKMDNINNCYLTDAGKQIFEQVSRENIIDKLI